ncbi:909_t:CDS:2 [Funneliformis mosseae]|uniref:909_t:CDS:1 n=1 Tax=Funneliformis mosseae TaxID=27381 RepID=A0A9N9CS94_FUNMO|nr:909_t:CDS:2 [Funneliformis mosseae]
MKVTFMLMVLNLSEGGDSVNIDDEDGDGIDFDGEDSDDIGCKGFHNSMDDNYLKHNEKYFRYSQNYAISIYLL